MREVNGRLAGYVVNPDDTRVGSNVQVKISFSSDYMIRTDTNGFFDTQIAIPAEIEPPGLLMYRWMSDFGSSNCKYNN